MKNKYLTDKIELEKKIPSNFVKKIKLTELENKITDVSILATKTALAAVENKISNVSILVKKQITTQKREDLKKNFPVIITTNILLIQKLLSLLLLLLNS